VSVAAKQIALCLFFGIPPQSNKDLLDELARLQSQQASIRGFENLDEKVLEYCQRVSQNLESLNFEEKRLLLDALEVKVFVYYDHTEVRGLLPPHTVPSPSYVTIARTSGCLPFHAYVGREVTDCLI
jgi:hypothetical protein